MRIALALLVVPALGSSLASASPQFVTEVSPDSGVSFARQVLPAGSPGTSYALAQSRIIYLNKNGVTLRPGDNDSRTNYSTIVSQQTAIPAWNTSAQEWTDTVNCFKDIWSRFDVQIVTTDPGNVPHIEAVFGGTPGLVGLPSGVGGVSPFTTDCSIIENSVVFTFTDAIPGITARQACEIMSQEVAHSYGLDHELLASDPMTYLSYNGNRAFQDQTASCGESTARVCGINGSQCRPNQNSVQLLLARVGTADAVAPVLNFQSPADGATVPPGFDVTASGSDNIAVVGATLYLDGTQAGTQQGAGPFTFTTDAALAEGSHVVKVEITDGKNVQSQSHTVTVQKGASPGGGSGSGSGSDSGSGGGSSGDPAGDSNLVGGCATGGGQGGALALLGLGLAAVTARRRRR